jgi:iron complex outermembrane receptor protein
MVVRPAEIFVAHRRGPGAHSRWLVAIALSAGCSRRLVSQQRNRTAPHCGRLLSEIQATMKNLSLFRKGKLLCLAPVLTAALSLSGGTAVFGQTPGAAAADSPQKLEAFVVTGSYLPVSAEVNASPIVTIERAEVGQSGTTDPLRLLKALTPVFTGNGNTGNEVDNGGFGESYVALRNLSTLVLLNGRRLANSPFSSNTSAATTPGVDLNTIPMGMIERIEILKDSASTIYGSDAIGGVINVILRKNYNGAEFGARYGSDRNGDYTTKEAWMVAGAAHPGVSLTIGAQYAETTPLLTTQRKLSILNPAELAAMGQNPSTLPSYMSSSFAGRNGNFIIAGSPLAVGAPGYNAAIKTLPPKTNPNAAPLTTAQLQALGYYIPITATPLSQAAGNSATILNTALYDNPLILPNQRHQVFAIGEKELLGKSFRVFGDFLYSKTVNGGSGLAPSPLSSVAGVNLTIPANNPYNLFGIRLGVGGAPGAPGVRTRLVDIGNRSSENTVDTYRFVVGFRGDINERWSWETALNYARATGEQHIFGGANGAVMNQELIPLLNAQGGYVYDTSGRPLSVYIDKNGNNVPVYDWFGIGGTNAPSTIDALRTTLFKAAQIDQRGVDFRVTGRPFELPAGDVAMAIGGESRRERLSSQADSNFTTGLALGYNASNSFESGKRSTRAAFLETNLPLTAPKNAVPMMYRADLTAAVRHERIQPGGNATTPKFGLRLLPFDQQLVVRATYAKGFIAPSIFALFGPPNQNAPTLSVLEGNGQTGTGGSTGRFVTGQFISQDNELSNPGLAPAKSESYTAGFVYSPKQIKGLNFSVDYYHIKQDKVGGFDYTYIAADLNARGAGSPYAANFRFTDGTRLTANTPNQVTSTNFGILSVVYNPVGDQWTDGLDLATSYQFRTERYGFFELGADATVIFNFKARTSPTGQYYQYARNFTDSANGKANQQGVLPKYAVKAHLNYAFRDLRASLQLSHLPELNAPGTAFGEPAGTVNAQRADGKAYTIPDYTTANLTLTYLLPSFGRAWAKGFSVTAGVNNVFDRAAPFVPGGGSGGGTEANTAKYAYDIIGRFGFLELKKEF